MHPEPVDPAPLRTAIILFDIVDFSKLSDLDQFRTLRELTAALRGHLDELACQAHLSADEVLLGLIPTGDGLYLLLRERYAAYGVLLALSLRTLVLATQRAAGGLFAGVRTAVHVGTLMPLDDITGGCNFVGSGLNDCARFCACAPPDSLLDEVGCTDGNWLLASTPVLRMLDAAFSFPAALDYRRAIALQVGAAWRFQDKHGSWHEGAMVEATRFLDGPPPPLPELPFASA